jgi:hypothetical protein
MSKGGLPGDHHGNNIMKTNAKVMIFESNFKL